MKIETGKLYFLATAGVCECLSVREEKGEVSEVTMERVATKEHYLYSGSRFIKSMVLREATVADVERTIDNNRTRIAKLLENIEDVRKSQERLDAWRDRLESVLD